MSNLEQLIQELCPVGVRVSELKSVATIERGKRVVKKDLKAEGTYPVFQNCLTPMGYYDSFNFSRDTPFIIVGGAAGEIGFSNVDFWAADDCVCISGNSTMLNKYIFYFLTSRSDFIKTNVRKASIPRLSRAVIESLKIPVPPLPIQREIVRILDNFTELTARKKQYEYYRDHLFVFDDKIPKVRLKDIATISRGGNFQKKDFCETGAPCIHYGQIYTKYGVYTDKTIQFISEATAQKQKKAVSNDVIMAVTSENIEDVCKSVAWLGTDEVAVSGHTAIIHHNQNAKYLSYFFHTSMFFTQKRTLAHGTKVIEVTPDKLYDVVIPLPSLEEQARIVKILDRFDALCNDLTAGLPAEIKARQKQYEYYRDKLLAFQPLGQFSPLSQS